MQIFENILTATDIITLYQSVGEASPCEKMVEISLKTANRVPRCRNDEDV